MKLMKNKKYLQQKFSRKVLVLQTTTNFASRVSKSYVPFTCKFPMVMHFVPILHRRFMSKTNFYVFSYDKAGLKFCASFRFFLAVFMDEFLKILYIWTMWEEEQEVYWNHPFCLSVCWPIHLSLVDSWLLGRMVQWHYCFPFKLTPVNIKLHT